MLANKRSLFCLLIVVFFFSLLALEYSYAETSGDYEYTVNSDEVSATITGYSGNASDLNIPSVLDGYHVTKIGQFAFEECSSLVNVTVPDSITGINDWAFADCANLKNIQIPDSVTEIGSYALYGCGLTEVTIPKHIKYMESEVLSRCTSLTAIHFLGNEIKGIGWGAFRECSSLKNITIPDSVTSIGGATFSGCTSLAQINIPEGVKAIEGDTFSGCSSLKNIDIPDSVVSIGDYAFSECSSLTQITIQGNVTDIGNYAFYECSNLTQIAIPEGVTSIEDYTFYGCSSLAQITIPESITDIGISAFSYCESLIDIEIPDGVTSIGDYAFSGCNMTAITIPSTVICIGESAFSSCSKLEEITISNGVTSIGDHAFYRCNSLTQITIPGSVENIGKGAFYECRGLTDLTIENGDTSIGNQAFYECSNLERVTIQGDITSIDDSAFSGCRHMTQITFGGSVESIGDYAFSECFSLTEITIPEGVTNIGAKAFYDCVELNKVVIPASVTSIGAEAFTGCSLTSITIDEDNTVYDSRNDCNAIIETATNTLIRGCCNTIIPGDVTSIEQYAFCDCKGLKDITIPGSVVALNENTFVNCDDLQNVKIDEGMVTLDLNAFYDCDDLKNIELPASIETIVAGEELDLDSIHFAGDKTQWGNIVVDGGSISDLFSNVTVYFGDSTTPDYPSDPLLKYHVMLNTLLEKYADRDFIMKKHGNYYDSKKYNMTEDQILELKAAAESVVQGCSTDYEKIKAVNDYVADRTYYDWPAYTYDDEKTVNAYKVWVGKLTVCDGYARLSEVLLDLVGIPCLYVEAAGDDELHAYNAAYDSEQQRWIYFDSTWYSGNAYYGNDRWYRGEANPEYFDMSLKLISSIDYHKMINIFWFLDIQDENYYYGVGDDLDDDSGLSVVLEVKGIKNKEEQEPEIIDDLYGIPIYRIDDEVFSKNKTIVSISIPRSVRRIGWNTFYGCENLKTVYYSGTMNEWHKVSILNGNEYLEKSDIVCTDGTINKENTLKVSARKKTVRYRKLKSKAVTVKAIYVKAAEGTVRYSKISGSSKLKINKKTGKITIKKKTRKGTYKIKVKVTASGSGEYRSGTKKVIVKIRVK